VPSRWVGGCDDEASDRGQAGRRRAQPRRKVRGRGCGRLRHRPDRNSSIRTAAPRPSRWSTTHARAATPPAEPTRRPAMRSEARAATIAAIRSALTFPSRATRSS